MILDWLTREGWIVITWWVIAALAGLGALPLCLRLLGWLPDKGYTLARTAGILLTAFVFWLLASLGFLRNDTGSIVLSWLIVLVLGIVVFFGLHRPAAQRTAFDWGAYWRDYWRENRPVIIAAEVLFIVLLLGWALVKAHQNDLNGTEKPMDLAFLSAIMRTETFPPPDPWLSGYTISYYYFGYVIGAMFSNLSGVASTIGYNMWTAMLFALTGLTTFGVVYNMVRSIARRRATNAPDPRLSALHASPSRPAAVLTAFFGVMLMVIVGNYELPFVEIPYQTRTATAEYLQFWDVNLRQEPQPPFAEGTGFDPANIGSDWFRSARALNDRNLPEMVAAGQPERVEVINEFPQFSFLLADNHPHVMSLPFTLLALGLSLNLMLSALALNRLPNREETLFYGIVVGALVFLNTWDAPIHIVVMVGAYGVARLFKNARLSSDDLWSMARLGLSLVLVMIVAYLPFLVGFRSQLGGALPNILYPTLFQQYFLTFGPLVPIVALFILHQVARARGQGRMNWMLSLQSMAGLFLGLLVIMLALIVLALLVPDLRGIVENAVNTYGGWGAFLPAVLSKRLTHIITTLVLLLGLGMIIGRMIPALHAEDKRSEFARPHGVVTYLPETGFALLLVAAALGLTLIPEFFYLRDNFGTRMNTVFKFYYQAWALFAVGGAFGMYLVLADVRERIGSTPLRAFALAFVAFAVFLGLLYPFFGISFRTMRAGTRVMIGDEQAITLDGWRTVVRPSDYEVLTCLQEIVGRDPVVVVEATGGSYDFFAFGGVAAGRTGALTGMPTVIGWQGHQSQWRGRGYGDAVGNRPADIPRLYQDVRLDMVQDIIDIYNIDYILYGPVERERYGAAGEEKFLAALPIVCESGDSRVYRAQSTAR